jgi:hypothetical protein
VAASPWPGDAAVATADGLNVLGGNMSGLAYEPSGTTAPGVLWAVKNGPGTLYRLVWNGTVWTPDPSWSAGKALRYPGSAGDPDAEGVTFAGAGAAGGIYMSAERNNAANSVSRNSVLLFDPATPGGTLAATREWNLTADLPAVGPNLGLEAITWVPDQFLVSRGFFNESKNRAYDPAEYPNHGTGLFFVGMEANGLIFAYALNHADGSFTRIATIVSGFAGVMGLDFDRQLNQFWVVCDDGCNGRSALLDINTQGRLVVSRVFERPPAMPNLNNEGFAVAAQLECSNNRKPAFWADDGGTDGHAIRRGTVPCNDDDGDGIVNTVDPAPTSPTNQTFSDALAPLTGSTSGTILARNGKTVSITDALPNPATGVNVLVGGPGTGQVQIRLDGKLSTISLANGAYVLTDPVNTSTVTAGAGGRAEIRVTFNGLPVIIVVGDGASITFTETTDASGRLTGFRVDTVAGNVTLNGMALTAPIDLIGPPTNADQCKENGWRTFNFPSTFKNQGDCVSYVQTQGRNPAAGR